MGKDLPQKSPERLKVLAKIDEYEKNGWFDKDVEDDPPTIPLEADDVDYTRKKLKSKINAKVSSAIATRFLNKLIKSKQLIIKNIVGLENLQSVKSGAVLTCNHFNPFDNLAVQYCFKKAKIKKKKIYTVIREGNYTNFPGFYGYLMRNCYTLPLSSSKNTMEKFLTSTNTLLEKGNFVLVYAEQSLWWNYKKPKPLKKGAFNFAYSANVPVIPIFITMQDSDILGDDGFFVQEYTVHIFEPIFPNKNLSKQECIDEMMKKNFALWKDCYESFYGIKLEYTTQNKK